MKELKLTKYVQTNATVLDNEFIDQYMVRANGEYVKVYLLLLRHMNQSSGCLSVSELADLLECTAAFILSQQALVTEDIDTIKAKGQVEIRGQIWSAKTDEPDGTIPKNTVVVVNGIQGVKLIVHAREE